MASDNSFLVNDSWISRLRSKIFPSKKYVLTEQECDKIMKSLGYMIEANETHDQQTTFDKNINTILSNKTNKTQNHIKTALIIVVFVGLFIWFMISGWETTELPKPLTNDQFRSTSFYQIICKNIYSILSASLVYTLVSHFLSYRSVRLWNNITPDERRAIAGGYFKIRSVDLIFAFAVEFITSFPWIIGWVLYTFGIKWILSLICFRNLPFLKLIDNFNLKSGHIPTRFVNCIDNAYNT